MTSSLSPELPAKQLGPHETATANWSKRWKRTNWFGTLPNDWDSTRIKRLFRIVNGATPKSTEPSYWNGPIPWATPEDLGSSNNPYLRATRRTLSIHGLENCGASVVPQGSLLLSTRAPIGYVRLAAQPTATNQGCRSLIPEYAVGDSRYYYYVVTAAQPILEAYGTGSTFTELSSTELGLVELPVPPFQLQSAIAEFLERTTTRIDDLIAKKERLIELLEEKRTALITQAVTKGLDPDVEMKDSGVEWLGEIPEHWDLARLSRAVDGCFNGIWGDKPNGEHDVACLRVEDFDRFQATVRTEEPTTRSVEPRYRSQRQLEVGDLLLEKSGGGEKQPVGFVVLVNQLDRTSVCSNFAARMPVRNGVSPSFLRYVFYHLYHTGVNIRSIKQTTGIQNLDASHYLSTPFALPSISVQHEIARYLEDQTDSIRRLILRIQEAIDRLHEYRSTLITAAVTGKIDVRDRAV